MDENAKILIRLLLEDEAEFQYFLEFVDHTKCSESLFFWKEIENYHTLWKEWKETNHKMAENPKDKNHTKLLLVDQQISAKAKDIYDMYLENSRCTNRSILLEIVLEIV
jgi:hypothetical protein